MNLSKWKPLCSLALVLSLATPPLLAKSINLPFPQDYKTVYEYLDMGEFSELASIAEMQIKKGGKVDPKWYEYLAIAKLHDDLNKDAFKAFTPARTAARMQPNNAHALSTLALVLCFMQKFDVAIDLARKACVKDPKDGRNHAILAYSMALMDQGDPVAAEEMKIARKLSPGDLDVNFVDDIYSTNTAQDKGIDAALARWLKYRPKSAYVYFRLCDFHKDTHEDNKSVTEALKALEINPGFEAPARVLARTYYERKQWQKGVDLLTSVLKHKSGTYHTHGRLGQFYAELNQPQKAIEHLNIAIKLIVPESDPNKFYKSARKIEKNNLYFYTAWWQARAAEYAKAGQVDKGVSSLSDLLSVLPDNSLAMYTRSQVFMRAKKYEQALRDLNALVIMDPDVPEWYKAKIDVLKKMGKNVEAAKVQKEHFAVEKYGSKN
ncbi:hypothetical protein KA183_11515 [bacterium]|nr:hypothetical protein [bacterium]